MGEVVEEIVPFGKQPHNYGKSPFLWVKQLFDWAIFNSFLYVYQRVCVAKDLHDHVLETIIDNWFWQASNSFETIGHLALQNGLKQSVFGCIWLFWLRMTTLVDDLDMFVG